MNLTVRAFRPAPSSAARYSADRDLALRAHRGDRDALAQFLPRLRCVPRFVARANLRHGRPLDADALQDVVQDVFTLVWVKLNAYQGEGSLETWIYRFCQFELRNAARRAATRRMQSLEELAEENSALVGAADDGADQRENADELLSRLDAEDAEILRSKHRDDATFLSLAAQLATSPNTLKTRYYRALQRLRRTLRVDVSASA